MRGNVFGASVKRLEDPALLRGRARYIDDITLPGMLEAAFLRSPHGHAAIGAIDVSAALAHPGVHAVYTLGDLKPCLTIERLEVGLPSSSYKQDRNRPVLAGGEVVHVGEPVAIVVAGDRYTAEDALERIKQLQYAPERIADPNAVRPDDAAQHPSLAISPLAVETVLSGAEPVATIAPEHERADDAGARAARAARGA